MTHHRPTTTRVIALGAVLALAAGISGCGATITSGRPSSASPTARASDVGRASAAGAAHDSTADVTAGASAASSRIATLRQTVAGWNGSCAATSNAETYLAAAQRALGNDSLRGAKALVALAAASVQKEVRHGLVTPAHASWLTDQARSIIRSIPSSGQVTPTASFPLPPKALRCTGATPESSPTAAKPMFMMAAADNPLSFLGTPSTEESVHTAVEIGIGSIPTVVGLLAPETEVPEAAIAIIEGLTNLFWPKTEPDNVTWEDMTTYVGNEIDKAVTTIQQQLDTQQIATMDDDLTALHTAIDRYTQDMNNLTKSTTSYAGVADADRSRAYADWLTLNNEFTTMLPHFTNDPTSYKNLPETINLYTLYLLTLRGWVLSPDVFNNNAAQTATWKAEREAELKQAIATAQKVVAAQLPQLEASQPTGTGSPLDTTWNRHWALMDALYSAGYNQVYDWTYMDPEVYVPDATTGRIDMPADKTVVSTPCYGAYEVPAPAYSPNEKAGLYVDGDPSGPLNAWLNDPTGAAGSAPIASLFVGGAADSSGIVALGERYQGQTYTHSMGNHLAGTYSAVTPNGGQWLVKGWVTRVQGVYTPEEVDLPAGDQSTEYGPTTQLLYGGFVHVNYSATTGLVLVGPTAAQTTTPSTGLVPATTDTGPATFDVSFPGYVLAGTAFLPGAGGVIADSVDDNGKQDSCVAFAFRLQDSY